MNKLCTDSVIDPKFKKERCYMKEFLARVARNSSYELVEDIAVMLSCPCNRCSPGTL